MVYSRVFRLLRRRNSALPARFGEEAEDVSTGTQIDLFNFSAPFRKVPQFITLFAGYNQPLPDQHVYGVGNDPLEIQFGATSRKKLATPRAVPLPSAKTLAVS